LPAFLDEPADSPISEIALRVLVEFEGGESHVVGTATLISVKLAITAKHVLEDIVSRFGAQKKAEMHLEVRNYAVRLYQVLRGPVYRIWNVDFARYCETDIALLQLGEFRGSHRETVIEWKTPLIRSMPPPVGQKVIAFGYRESSCAATPIESGGYHLELQDQPTISVGGSEKNLPYA
jgi:V8-like Glu-specific endopeptidase